MAYIAPKDNLKLLSNALGGAAKGAQDFATLSLEKRRIDESSRQFDENLEFGFKKLDEQIRQFDVGTDQRERLEQARLELQGKLTREGYVSAEKRSEISKQATLGAASIRAREMTKDREQAARLQERNLATGNRVNDLESFGANILEREMREERDRIENMRSLGMPVEEAQYNKGQEARINEMARELAEHWSVDGIVDDMDLKVARDQIINYKNTKSSYIKTTAQISAARKNEQMLADGAWGDSIAADQPVELTEKIYVKGDQNMVVPSIDWAKELKNDLRSDPLFGATRANKVDKVAGLVMEYEQAITGDNVNRPKAIALEIDDMLTGYSRDEDFTTQQMRTLKRAVSDRMIFSGNMKEGGWSEYAGTYDELAQQQPVAPPTEAEAAEHAAKVQANAEHIDATRRQRILSGEATQKKVDPNDDLGAVRGAVKNLNDDDDQFWSFDMAPALGDDPSTASSFKVRKPDPAAPGPAPGTPEHDRMMQNIRQFGG